MPSSWRLPATSAASSSAFFPPPRKGSDIERGASGTPRRDPRPIWPRPTPPIAPLGPDLITCATPRRKEEAARAAAAAAARTDRLARSAAEERRTLDMKTSVRPYLPWGWGTRSRSMCLTQLATCDLISHFLAFGTFLRNKLRVPFLA